MNTNTRNYATTIACITTIIALTLFTAMRSEAIEIKSPLKIFTFAGATTESAMRAKDYERVIDGYRRFGATYGYHDLVNLCAAYLFVNQYPQAATACSGAEKYRPQSELAMNYRGPDSWVAYANHAVVSALAGNYETAKQHIIEAQRRGGDADILTRNLIAIEELASDKALITAND